MYQPSQEILEKYADLLVNFALNSGEGVKEDEVVQIIADDVAKPLLFELYKAVIKAGAHPMVRMIPTEFSRSYYELASDKQLKFFPEKYNKAKIELLDHQIGILSEVDPFELKDIDPKKIMMSMDAAKKIREWREEKENRGEFTWTLALYGTKGMAAEAKMSLDEYWETIIEACYLDKADPIKEWKKITDEQERLKKVLNDMKIESLHVKGENVDLTVKLGPKRKWMGGSGRNIPSYELFISPDWRGTQGFINFNQPLYSYGNMIKDVKLVFKDGIVVESSASQGEDLLKNMLERENANKVGEFSLTDARFSRINKFMANTLFDENMGGDFGNTHIAVGSAYKDSYIDDPQVPTKDEWDAMGYNESPEHTDIISTEDRTVTATLSDGTQKVIYEKGSFTV